MRRRDLLTTALAASLTQLTPLRALAAARTRHAAKPAAALRPRVRLTDPDWPSDADWEQLRRKVGGRLIKPVSPFAACQGAAAGADCAAALEGVGNPYWLGEQPALTQASGWVDAWTTSPSVYAVAAGSSADVAAAVKFARERSMRLVVKGGGHSYQGTSSAPESLLVWTRGMRQVKLHPSFKAQGCDTAAAQPAVSIGAGALWGEVYEAVTVRGGRYVQGGGCRTVGVAGLVQSGGFGSFSKRFGTAAAGLIEAEVVTADGRTVLANECQHPDLFWALKGGGGGSFGVVTRVTLRTRELPAFFGAVLTSIKAGSDEAYKGLIAKALELYSNALFNPHWGEQMRFSPANTLEVAMLFQGLTRAQAQAAWAPFFTWVKTHKELSFTQEPAVMAVPARRFWDADFMAKEVPGVVRKDPRKGASPAHAWWAADGVQAGELLHGFQSAWLPATLLAPDKRAQLAEACFAASRHWSWALHFNKGLAGAPETEIALASDTATHPQMLDAFALAIVAGAGPAAYPGMPGEPPDLAVARQDAQAIEAAMGELLKVAPGAGSYVSESSYFLKDWQSAHWGANHKRLAVVKAQHDSEGIFYVHHGVGSEAWKDDGFTPLDS